MHRENLFQSELKKAKVVLLPKYNDKTTDQLETNITSVCFVKASRKACTHSNGIWKIAHFLSAFSLSLDVNTSATLHWDALQILG